MNTMRLLLLANFFFLIHQCGVAQKRIKAADRENAPAVFWGMGINAVAANGLTDYLKTIAHPSQQPVVLTTGIEFFGGMEIPLSQSYGLKLDYGYLFKSYSLLPMYGGAYTLFYNVHMPSILAQYSIAGEGFFVKFGAGGGYHWGNVEETYSLYGVPKDCSAQGMGLKAEVVGETAFDENFYGYIGASLRGEFLGKVKDAQGNELRSLGQSASLSLFSAGIAFGAVYFF